MVSTTYIVGHGKCVQCRQPGLALWTVRLQSETPPVIQPKPIDTETGICLDCIHAVGLLLYHFEPGLDLSEVIFDRDRIQAETNQTIRLNREAVSAADAAIRPP